MLSGNLSFSQLTPIEQLAFNIAGLNIGATFKKIVNSAEVKSLIIKLNTDNQLFKKGENSLGVRLDAIGGGYAGFTIEEKKRKGQPFDRVTLNDTGDFYGSWTVNATVNYIDINADPIKEDANLFTEWGSDIVGLNEENLQLVTEIILKEIIRFFKSQI